MKKFNSTALCLSFLLFVVSNTANAQDSALNINLSNVMNPVAKSSLLSPASFANSNSYSSLFAPKHIANVLPSSANSSIMFMQSNSQLSASTFANFTPRRVSSSSSINLRVRGILGNGSGAILGCSSYPTTVGNSSLATYYGNGSSTGTPILNSYYKGSTGNNTLNIQTRTSTPSSSSKVIGFRKQ